MHCLLVFTKFSLLRKLFVALPARMFDSFMYCPLVLRNIFFEVAWWLHYWQMYLTPVYALWCSAKCSLSHWPQRYLTPSCIQLLLTRFGPNFNYRVLGTSRTDSICHCDICPANICPGGICPYLEYLSCYWLNFDQTLMEGSWGNLQ